MSVRVENVKIPSEVSFVYAQLGINLTRVNWLVLVSIRLSCKLTFRPLSLKLA